MHGGPVRRIAVRPVERLAPGRISVPGDFSSAAFLAVAAAIVPGSEVRLEGVGLNPTRIGLLGILNRMGAAIEVEEDRARGGRSRAGRSSPATARSRATRVHGDEVPLAIDELPLVALLGCFAEGKTVVSGAAELRHKESDRIASVVEGLRGLGAEIEAHRRRLRRPRHRRASRRQRSTPAATTAWRCWARSPGLASREGVEVAGVDAAAVSYPGFEADLRLAAGCRR